MTQYLILPLGGVGQRFIDEGYKTYKPFLKVSKNNTIIDKIVSNFPRKKTKAYDDKASGACSGPRAASTKGVAKKARRAVRACLRRK